MTPWLTIAAVKAELTRRLSARSLLAEHVIDGVPWRAEDVMGPQGDGVSVWVDNDDVTAAVEPTALGFEAVRETYQLVVVVQCLALESGRTISASEARCAELASDVIAEVRSAAGSVVAVDGWAARIAHDGWSWRSAPMPDHGGYAVAARVSLEVMSDRC
jgi:hypothetical protein